MRIFLTGATGFIGSALIPELQRAGHAVVGLARSDAGADKLTRAGVDVLRGSLTDVAGLRAGAAASDGVIHCAFSHDDFTDRAGNCEKDRVAIDALGGALVGSGKPFVVTSGCAWSLPGLTVTEDRMPDEASFGLRAASEHAAFAFAERGVRVSIVRLPPSVHDVGDRGFVPMLMEIAKRTGRSGYIGAGANLWPAVHRADAVRVYRLALERAPARTVLHAIGDEGIATRAIAEAIGQKLGLPVASVAREHFSWLGNFFALDTRASAALTRERFGFAPAHLGLLEDIARNYPS